MKGGYVFILYCLSNLSILVFVFIYGLFSKIWPLQLYFGIWVFLLTILFGRILYKKAR